MGKEAILNAYLREIADKPFRFGRHDCFTFTNEAWRRMYGAGWADDWAGRYLRVKNETELMADDVHNSVVDAVSARLTRCVGIPPRCALVMGEGSGGWVTGQAFGLAVGANAAFLSDSGVIYLPITDINIAWVQP